jgi:tRNA modification GTPase
MPANAVLLTPPATGAIAVFLLAGQTTHSSLQSCCNGAGPAMPPGTVRRVTLRAGQDVVDDGLLICTSPDIFELHLHGGPAVVQRAAEVLGQNGIEVLDPRSDAGKAVAARWCVDPAYRTGMGAEIFAALPLATTATALQLLANQLRHGLGAWRDQWLDRLMRPIPLWQFHSDVQWIVQRSATLRWFIAPPRIAIVGPPNAGKSTLANALLGRPVSISSDIPGTTRDWVDAMATLASGPTRLAATFVDTAGLRTTPDPIEQESIRRSHVQIRQADALVAVLDGSDPAAAAFLDTLGPPQNRPPTLIAINKSDLQPAAGSLIGLVGTPLVHLSAVTQHGLPDLVAALMQLLDVAGVDEREPFAFSERQLAIMSRLALSPEAEDATRLLHEL